MFFSLRNSMSDPPVVTPSPGVGFQSHPTSSSRNKLVNVFLAGESCGNFAKLETGDDGNKIRNILEN